MLLTGATIVSLTLLAAWALTALARCIAPGLGMVDRPDGARKQHATSMPLLGGVAIYIGFASSVLATAIYDAEQLDWGLGGRANIPALLGSAGLFCLLGVWDDRFGIRARHKFLGQIIACLPFVVWGRSIESVGLLGVHLDLGLWSAVVTVFWLVTCSNVINLMDGMDGLAGTISLIALVTVAALSVAGGQHGIALLSILAATSACGFLIHNWPPAKIFMGDSGSLMLGFLIGALSIESALKQAAGFTLVAPLVLISVPVFDTSMAILRRKLSGRSIGHADRGHLHHRLQDRGLSRIQALLSIIALSTAMAGIAIVSTYLQSELLAIGLCISLLALLIVCRVFGHHEAALLIEHSRETARLLTDGSRSFSNRLIAVRLASMEPDQRDEYWDLLCRRLSACGGQYLEFCFSDEERNKVFFRRVWGVADETLPSANNWLLQQSAPRDEGILATVRASGTFLGSVQGMWLSDAARLLQSLCLGWPLEDLLFGDADDSMKTAEAREPDLILLQFPAEQFAQNADTESERIVPAPATARKQQRVA